MLQEGLQAAMALFWQVLLTKDLAKCGFGLHKDQAV